MWDTGEVVRDRQARLRRQAEEHRLAAGLRRGRTTRTPRRRAGITRTWAQLWTLAVGAARRT